MISAVLCCALFEALEILQRYVNGNIRFRAIAKSKKKKKNMKNMKNE